MKNAHEIYDALEARIKQLEESINALNISKEQMIAKQEELECMLAWIEDITE